MLSREGAIVWGLNEYRKTGIQPYVHELGARVPSLRRLYKKRPYFTNGSAKTLRDVLDRARFGGAPGFFHDGAPAGLEALSEQEKGRARGVPRSALRGWPFIGQTRCGVVGSAEESGRFRPDSEGSDHGTAAWTMAAASRSKPVVPSSPAVVSRSTILMKRASFTPMVARSKASPPAAAGSLGEMPLLGVA